MKRILQSLIVLTIVISFSSCNLFGNGDVFEGGNGTFSNPYKLRTPKDVQNMRQYSTAYFKMIADIDMDGINWIPFELSGGFDGDNHTLYNLKISPVTSDYQGLFSKLSYSAFVKNLTINGFEVNAPSYSFIGAIAGYSKGKISNCNIVLNQVNAIIGKKYVGGLIGYQEDASVDNCSVSSSLSSSVIIGEHGVGGAIGYAVLNEVTNVHVRCNISGGTASYNYDCIGGVAGTSSQKLSQCSYSGRLANIGNSNVYMGGITGDIGTYQGEVFACKSNVTFEGADICTGGIVGTLGSGSYAHVYACYSQGDVFSGNYIGGVVGRNNGGGFDHCYTLMNFPICGNSSDSKSFSIKDLVNQFSNPINIAEIMRATNSEYASYWNYDNTWTWTGTVNGQSVTAICPKLAWE